MGTRSRIGVMHGDKCKSVYCHWDGYLSFNGQILQDHYDSARANHLVSLGDLSSLGKNIEVPEGIEHSFDKPAENISVFYGRDRGESGAEFKVALTFEQFLEQCENCGAEYYYIMKDGVWYCGDMYNNFFEGTGISHRLTPLTQALAAEKALA